MLKKSASLLLCLALMTTMVLSAPCTAMASSAYSSDTSSVREVFHGFRIDAEEASYSDDLFTTDPREYNAQLAALTFALGTASCNSRRIKDPSQYYEQMSKNVYEFLEDNGFCDIYVNKDFRVKPTDKTAGAIFAHKKIRDDGKDYTLLVIEPKGGTIGAEYLPVMNISRKKGDRDDYAAFTALRDRTLASARQYINMYDIKGDIKVWTAGYSRSGGLANLLAAALIDDPSGYLGSSVKLTPDNLYCYSLSSIITAENSKDLHAARYDSIHHIISADDALLKSPTEKLCFGLYGQVHYFNDISDKEEAVRQMDIRSHQAYEDYVNKDMDPDNFCPRKLDIKSLLKGELVLEEDDDSYLPYDQGKYLDSAMDNLTAVVSGNDSSVSSRDAYYEEYQGPLGRLVGTIGDLFDEGNADTSDVTSAVTGNKLTVPLVLSMYLTFIADKSVRDGTTASAEISASVESTFNALASQIEDENGHIRREYRELRKMDKAYVLFRNTYFKENGDEQGGDVSKKYSLRRSIKADKKFLETMRTLTARMYASVMRDILNVLGADEDTIRTMTSETDSRAVTYFLMHLFLGNDCQSEELRPLDLNNEQFKNLATFIGNINKYMTRHMATQTMPWLRAGDSHFDDAQPLTEAQTSGYRRVYVSGQPGVDVSGTVRNGDGTEVAAFRNGRITSRTESWIGITNYDSGYWLRLPLDEDYTVEFNVGSDSRLGLELAEYSVAEGKVLGTVRFPATDAYKNGSVVLNVPAAGSEESGYDLPSDAEYDVSTSGSAAPDTDDTADKTVYSKAVPKAKTVKAKAGRRSMTVSWKKLKASQRKKFSKTEVQYSTSKKFKTYKTVDVSKNKKSVKIKGLKKGKTYYVRVRNVKKKDGIRYVSKWSAKKKVRVR